MSLASARAKAGLSQKAVADKLCITDAAVCLWETGKTLPRASLLPKLAALYDCTVDELLRGDEPATGKETT